MRGLGLRFGLTDQPDTRKQHKTPVVRIGGIAMVLGFALALAVTLVLRGPLASCPGIRRHSSGQPSGDHWRFFCIGLADDLLSLPPLPRLSMQFLVATAVWEAGIRITAINLHLGGQVLQFSTGFSLLVTVLWLAGITNAINWIDGLDGLAAGVGGIAAVGLTVVTFYVNDQAALAPTLLAAALAGTCLGFLRHNLNPAQVFMGDGGSYFLGFALASISIIGPAKEFTGVSLLLPLMILLLPLADMSAVVMGRLRSGCSPFYPGPPSSASPAAAGRVQPPAYRLSDLCRHPVAGLPGPGGGQRGQPLPLAEPGYSPAHLAAPAQWPEAGGPPEPW